MVPHVVLEFRFHMLFLSLALGTCLGAVRKTGAVDIDGTFWLCDTITMRYNLVACQKLIAEQRAFQNWMEK